MAVTQPDSGTSQWKRVDAGYCGRCSSSCKTDIRQPSFEVMPRIPVLFGVTVDCLLCRGQALSGHLCPQRPGGPGGLRYDGNSEKEKRILRLKGRLWISCGNQKSAMTT